MARYRIQYIDHIDQDTVKEQIVGGVDMDDAESNLYRKTKCSQFSVLSMQELKGYFSKYDDAISSSCKSA